MLNNQELSSIIKRYLLNDYVANRITFSPSPIKIMNSEKDSKTRFEMLCKLRYFELKNTIIDFEFNHIESNGIIFFQVVVIVNDMPYEKCNFSYQDSILTAEIDLIPKHLYVEDHLISRRFLAIDNPRFIVKSCQTEETGITEDGSIFSLVDHSENTVMAYRQRPHSGAIGWIKNTKPTFVMTGNKVSPILSIWSVCVFRNNIEIFRTQNVIAPIKLSLEQGDKIIITDFFDDDFVYTAKAS